MQKVVLLLPAKDVSEIYDEQGIALIASCLRKNGHDVMMEVIRDLSELDKIDFEQVDIVGITAYHESLEFVFDISKWIKQKYNRVLVCLGGYSATYYAEEILNRCEVIDFIIEREGEKTFLEICEKLNRSESWILQKGIVFRDKEGVIVKNENNTLITNLSELPFSAKDIFEKNNMHLVEISTSRGCMNNCSFCYSHSYFDPGGIVKWRGRTVDDVINEIEDILLKYKVNKFYFNNASFEDSFPYKSFMIEFCKKVIEKEIKISFCVNFRTSFYKNCTKEEMELLLAAGLTGVFLGVEAFNQQDLKIYNKHTSVQDNLNSIRFFKDYSIGIDMGFINFNPYSSYESLFDNANCLYQTGFMGSLVFLNRLRAYKGTPLYAQIDTDGLMCIDDFLNYYCYKYKEKNIGEFADFVNRIFTAEYQTIPGSMYYFTMYHNQLISHLKRIYHDNSVIINIIDSYEKERREILKRANEFCYQWYMKLLRMLRTEWDINMANKIVKDDKVAAEMNGIVNALRVEFAKFTQKILRVDFNGLIYLK